MRILVLNGGSSSLKCWYHDLPAEPSSEPPEPLWKKNVSWSSPAEVAPLLAEAFGSIPGPVEAIGHRIVHGGKFHESALLKPEVRAAIQKQAELAPAHNSLGLAVIEAVDRAFGPNVPQIGVFDTAFHST